MNENVDLLECINILQSDLANIQKDQKIDEKKQREKTQMEEEKRERERQMHYIEKI